VIVGQHLKGGGMDDSTFAYQLYGVGGGDVKGDTTPHAKDDF
jgi:hypothetical protein